MANLHTPQDGSGWRAPAFDLPGTDGRRHTLDSVRGAGGTVVMFICNHCPYVVHVMSELGRLGRDYLPRGVAGRRFWEPTEAGAESRLRELHLARLDAKAEARRRRSE